MKIADIRLTPLLVPYTKPYYWSQGVIEGAGVVLVEVETTEGVIGYGESVATPSAEAVMAHLRIAASRCIGRSVFESNGLLRDAYQVMFQAYGTCSSPRYAGQVLAGLSMALWDAAGKTAGQPVHALLGGKVRDEIRHFGFCQGETAEEVADDAEVLAAAGFDVIYFKVGRGDALDLETARMVRDRIGPDHRMRVDPNEKWNPLHASRMIRKLADYGVELVEQPCHCESVMALAQIRAASPIPIGADQSVFTPFEAFDVIRAGAADMITIGLHETGGFANLLKIAHIAEAADVNICLHGLYETGITTCAGNQVAAVIPNLDDANQHMTRFLDWDIVKSPDLTPVNGAVKVLEGPGLGFEIDHDNVARAAELHRARNSF
ncbi:mandelate racemase/muconate lactonizing enzyme family protein [Xinfangfangia sp. CPCC 101601]|uniref:Mandelate racemase/muconate lactonizing enzyme family protein n=1 Tax=Pseudogemmobacter lacusdianii TaxID=3069608 RepID=A0ABU0W197_9RHOB|nr:mandelate racemase/muconate lactonizing enzyme family protein [Xinfangfangia sp. CPCC 101601]MDQ2067794.1 mandelate racemase/muconate lactonizing enzyme family protein [Xinfangfangia sp. CPCC 101601]